MGASRGGEKNSYLALGETSGRKKVNWELEIRKAEVRNRSQVVVGNTLSAGLVAQETPG